MTERLPGELGERIHHVVGERKLTRSGLPTLLEVGLLELRMRLERQAAAGDERTSAVHRAIAITVRLDPDRIDPAAARPRPGCDQLKRGDPMSNPGFAVPTARPPHGPNGARAARRDLPELRADGALSAGGTTHRCTDHSLHVTDLWVEVDYESPTGAAIHVAIANVLTHLDPTESLVHEIVDQVLASAPRHVRGPAGQIAVYTGVWAYLRRCHPGTGWLLAASELRLGNAIADLVFVNVPADALDPRPAGEGSLLIDELKCGMSRAALSSSRTRSQVLRLLAGGREKWGSRLVGVRLVAPAFRLAYLISEPSDLISLEASLQ